MVSSWCNYMYENILYLLCFLSRDTFLLKYCFFYWPAIPTFAVVYFRVLLHFFHYPFPSWFLIPALRISFSLPTFYAFSSYSFLCCTVSLATLFLYKIYFITHWYYVLLQTKVYIILQGFIWVVCVFLNWTSGVREGHEVTMGTSILCDVYFVLLTLSCVMYRCKLT